MRNKVLLTATLILTLASAGIMAQAKSEETKPTVSKPDISGLYETVKKFQDAWYKEKNQDKFWSFVASDSNLKESRKSDSNNPFFIPFEVKPEETKPETLKTEGMSKESLEKIQKENLKPAPLNLATATEMVILKPSDDFLKKSFHMTDETLAEAKKNNFFPKGDFLLVLYGVSGEGYYKDGVVSFWIKEGADWKLFNLTLVER